VAVRDDCDARVRFFERQEAKITIMRTVAPPNKALQRTEQTITPFAFAKRAPLSSAAELER
jgi:hypothetical protein